MLQCANPVCIIPKASRQVINLGLRSPHLCRCLTAVCILGHAESAEHIWCSRSSPSLSVMTDEEQVQVGFNYWKLSMTSSLETAIAQLYVRLSISLLPVR